MTQTPEGCSSMRKALKVLDKELGCHVVQKYRKGEWQITAPNGDRIVVSGTRKDIPRHMSRFIRDLRLTKATTMMNAPTFDSDKIALFDMDETLVDFQNPLRERLLKMCGPGEAFPDNLWDMPDHWYARAQAIKKEPGFWRNLPKLDWGWKVLEIAREIGFNIHILTKGPTTGSVAWSEKVDWAREHLPNAGLTITDDKRIAYGRVFVDDYWPFMELWLKNRPRGVGIVNYSSKLHPNLTSVHDGMDVVRQRLQEAYDR